ncbi:DUF411 domain-containing protein [Methyloceanibacter marginalis]|uniref:DUF411 domain-containing protein n=1 Tax=Methyloceanibacter marginalis TaxID=1774971 RepID=UPI003CC7A555
MIDGYAVEGHVPAADIKKLLEERPDALASRCRHADRLTGHGAAGRQDGTLRRAAREEGRHHRNLRPPLTRHSLTNLSSASR